MKILNIVVVDFEPGTLTPALEKRLRKGLRCVPCKGGVLISGTVYASPGTAVYALLTKADACLSRSRLTGGDDTATGRYTHDAGHFCRHAAAAVYAHRRMLWPELAA